MKKVLMGVLSLGLLLGAATGCTSDQEKAAGKTKASSEKTEATQENLSEPEEPDRPADVYRTHAAGSQHQLCGLLALSGRYAWPSVCVLHPDGCGCGIGDWPGHPGAAVP